MADDGFTVRAGRLASGSTRMTQLENQREQLAGLVIAALDTLAGAAGDAGVESAARELALSAERQFLGAGAGYQHTSAALTRTAAVYGGAEDAAVSDASGVASRLAGPR
jgi:hypothetical protein